MAREQANATRAKEVLERCVPVDATPAAANLASRGLRSPYPDNLRFLPDTRIGEGALVAVLEAHGAIIGVQITHLDPDGRKSLVRPLRETFPLERMRGKAGAFVLPASDPTLDTIIVCEGVEDALSVRQAGRGEWILGVLGAGKFQHIEVERGRNYLLVRDGDVPGSASNTGVTAGVDHILLSGAAASITPTPLGKDANSILQEAGPDALLELLSQVITCELSLAGEVRRLSQLDRVAYDQKRAAIAKKFGIRVGTLDDQVAKARPPRATADTSADGIKIITDAPWDGPIDLGACLDTILAEFKRRVAAQEEALAAAVQPCRAGRPLRVWWSTTGACGCYSPAGH